MNNKQREMLFGVFRTLTAMLIALLLAFAIILLVSKQPISALRYFMLGPLSTLRRMGNVAELTIPLIFTGLAACVMFQAQQFSMIGDGAFFFGGLMASMFALKVTMPSGIHPVAAILIGGVAGAATGLIPGFLKAKWDTNEFVTSMMLNYVLLYFGIFLLNSLIRDPNSGFVASYKLPGSSKLSTIIPGTKVSCGLFLAIFMIIVVYFFLYKTKWGYFIRMTGINKNFAEYSGVNTFMVIALSQVIGGLIAGMGGAAEVLGMYDRFQWQNSPGYGFDGLTVAILAANNPALVPVGAIFLAYLRVGADIMARMSDVPSEAISVIQAVIMLLVTASAFMSKWKHKLVVKHSKEEIAPEGGK